MLQILTNKTSSLISELIHCNDQVFAQNFHKTANTLSFVKTNLEWGDSILVQLYNNFITRTLEAKAESIKEISSAFFDENNVFLVKAIEDTEKQQHLLEMKQLGVQSDSLEITLFLEMLESKTENDWKNLFLFFYGKQVHILQYVMVSWLW